MEGTNSRISKKNPFRVVAMAQVGNAPQVDAVSRRDLPYVPCGKYNLFRELLRALADNAPAVNTVVNTMALYLGGKRLIFRDRNGEELEQATEVWNSLHPNGESYFRRAVCKDIALLGDRCFEVSPNGFGAPAAIYHMDAMRLRLGKKDAKGKVNEYHWCSNWELHNKFSKDYPITVIPAWATTAASDIGKGLMFAKDYHQGQDYYGMPKYLPALTDAEIITRVPRFNLTQIDTGFKSSVHAHLETNRDDADLEEIDKNFEAVYTGADGKNYILTIGSVGEKLTITKLERGDHAGELDKMALTSELTVYKACGLPPILAGIDVSTGMSGKALALDQSVTQYLRTQIQPMQWMLTDDALRIVQLAGVPEAMYCEVEQLVPFDPAADPALKRQTHLRSRTVNEERLADNLGKLTIDGEPEKADGSNLDPRGNLLLIEAGGQAGANEPTNDPTDATTNA